MSAQGGEKGAEYEARRGGEDGCRVAGQERNVLTRALHAGSTQVLASLTRRAVDVALLAGEPEDVGRGGSYH
jgi:hypothetical protein